MANNIIIGHMTCPICGEDSQDVKVNINNKLYTYCERGCGYKFNSNNSRKYAAELSAGKTVKTQTGDIINPIVKSKNNEELQRNEQTNSTRTRSGDSIDRWPSEQLARVAANAGDGTKRGGFFDNFFADDDE